MTPYSADHSEFDCQPGELALCCGARRRADGLYVPITDIATAPDDGDGIPPQIPGPLPIELGMVRAGALSCIEGVTARSGEGASATHPVVAAAGPATTATVEALYTDALARQATARGLFSRPFLVRHALRMPDGRYICVSAPVLMMPWMLPPCIAVSLQTQDDTTVATVSLQHVPVFALTMRLRGAIDPSLLDLADALDIFATDEIPTYDGDIHPNRYSTFARVAEGASRSHIVPQGETLAGRYDPGTGIHADHTVASLGLAAVQCLDLQPNPRLWDDIAAASTFSRIASIPLAQLRPGQAFTPVAVRREAGVVLTDPAMCGAVHTPDCSRTYAGRLYRGGGHLTMPSPATAGCLAQYVGDPSAPEAPARVEVRSRSHGIEAVVASEGLCAAAVADAPPRYVYYPDPGAHTLDLHCGGRCLRYRLCPHPTLHGAYATDCEVRSSEFAPTGPLVDTTCTLPAPGLITASVPGNPYVTDDALTIDLGEPVTALCAALDAPARGEFGRFPLYAFTDRGIYSLEAERGRAVLFHHLAGAPRVAPAPWHDSVVYIDVDGTVTRLSGTTVRRVCDLRPDPYRLPSLPRLRQVLEQAGCPYGSAVALSDLSAVTGMQPCDLGLILRGDGFDCLLDPDTGEWSTLPGDSERGWMLLITRCLRPDAPVESVAVDGHRLHEVSLALYGSMDYDRWQLIQTVRGPRLHTGTAHRWRALRLVVIAREAALYDLRCTTYDLR